MKKLTLIFFLLTSTLSISQTKVNSIEVKSDTTTSLTKNQNYPVTISIKKGEQQVVHDRNFYLSEIERIDSHIKAIDDKIKWVLENEIVKSEWIMEMNKTKQELIQEKSIILQKLNN